MKPFWWYLACVLCICSFACGAPPPLGRSIRILPPRFFPGWQSQNVCYPFVVHDEQASLYRLYYSGSGSEQWNDSVADQRVTGYVTSADTLTWSYPDDYEQVLFARKLYEGEVVDPAQNALIFDSVHATGACILRDGSLWKAWYTGWSGQVEHMGNGLTRKVAFRIGHATSADGLTWKKIRGQAQAGSVLEPGEPGQADCKGAAHPHVLKVSGRHLMWYEGFDGRYWRILKAVSDDGLTWSRQGVVFDLGPAGALDELGARNPLVFKRGGRYELWYQGQSKASPRLHILRATSPDGQSWTRCPQEVLLHPDQPLSADEGILADSAIVLPDGSVQVFFAKETTSTLSLTNGTIQRRNYYLYTEVVNP